MNYGPRFVLPTKVRLVVVSSVCEVSKWHQSGRGDFASPSIHQLVPNRPAVCMIWYGNVYNGFINQRTREPD